MTSIVDRALFGALIALSISSQAAASGPVIPCSALAGKALSIVDQDADPHGDADRGKGGPHHLTPTITAATLKAATATVPEYCRVEGYIITGDEKEGFGKTSFGVNLPTAWNNRFVMIGDGGFDGGVTTSTARLDTGYATANTDMGHSGTEFPGATFGTRRALEIDYGWRATHFTAVIAKGIMQEYYGAWPTYSYWDGCSTGGRQAAVEAQRFPGDFHGIVAGDLFNNAIEIAMEQIWSSMVFFKDVNGDGIGFDNNITQADVNALRDAVLAKCDVLGNDVIKDNTVGDPLECKKVFGDADIDALGAARGLRAGQIQAIKDVYRGPHSSTGHRWYKGKPLGSELLWGSFVVPTPANGNFPAQGGFSFQLVNYIWFEHDPGVPTARPNDPSLLPGPGEYRWLDFNFDTNTPTGKTVNGKKGPWTPNDGGGFMREILNGSDTDLRPFLVKRNAKYLLYHGWADGLIGPEPTVDYFKGIVRDTFKGDLERAQENVRFFGVPGMGHCSGGVAGAAVNWDKLPALVKWVEQGVAPDSIAVTSSGPVSSQTSRILCPWPLQPTYAGPSGSDPNDSKNWVAANFQCRPSPLAHHHHHRHHHDGGHDNDDHHDHDD